MSANEEVDGTKPDTTWQRWMLRAEVDAEGRGGCGGQRRMLRRDEHCDEGKNILMSRSLKGRPKRLAKLKCKEK